MQAAALFRDRFGVEPSVALRAPGRVNLIGEHVDYAEGIVLPIAIERETDVAARIADDETVIVSEALGSWHGDLRAIAAQHIEPHWASYVIGPLRELAARGVPVPNLEIAITSDVPIGAGLSSSAALEVATALVALRLAERQLDGLELARLCQRAEQRFAGTPCGLMDMTVSANARRGHAVLFDCRTEEMRHVPIPAGASILVVDSTIRHRLADGDYAARRAAVEEAALRLKVASLRDSSLADLEAFAMPESILRRARHVISEIARVEDAATALAAGDLSRLGQRMNESHASLRDDFDVSVPELDAIVDSAQTCDGVFGARMTGAGFGGCAVVLVRDDAAMDAMAAIQHAVRARFGITPPAFVTRAASGALESLSRRASAGVGTHA